jgi:hypothetical protein
MNSALAPAQQQPASSELAAALIKPLHDQLMRAFREK